MTSAEMTNPQLALQENAATFYEKFAQKYADKMSCRSGCAACCVAELTMFESEAAVIWGWIESQPKEQRSALLRRLQATRSVASRMPNGRSSMSCCFCATEDQSCLIYPARPIICRTQGLPLLLKVSEKGNDSVLSVDVCPLNFDGGSVLPPREEWLSLDRLTALQTIAEQHYQKSARVAELVALRDPKSGRVGMERLKKQLIKSFADKQEEE